MSETHAHLMGLRAREDEYKNQIIELTMRLQVLEEELHSRLIDSEDVHQQQQAFSQERRAFMERISQMEATLKERDKLLLEYTSKNKELMVNFHLEQESSQKLKTERDTLDKELKSAKDELLSLRSMQSSSADSLTQKCKELEIEKRSLKARVEQLEADFYKAGRERAEAVKEREKLNEEAKAAKKAKEEAEAKTNDMKNDYEKLKKELEEMRPKLL